MRTGQPFAIAQEEDYDVQELLQKFYKSRIASDFYKQSLEELAKQIQKDGKHPNLRQEEKLLLKEYQDYLEGVRV